LEIFESAANVAEELGGELFVAGAQEGHQVQELAHLELVLYLLQNLVDFVVVQP
jgi:hypothetical protein